MDAHSASAFDDRRMPTAVAGQQSDDSFEPAVPELGRPQEATAERAGRAPTGGGPASAAGALSVTRPPEDTPSLERPRLLLIGTDTLHLGLYVEFDQRWPRILAVLARAKKAASGTTGTVLGSGRCLVLAGGKPNYPYLLQYGHYQLFLSRHPKPEAETPNVFVSLGSRMLWELGERQALASVLDELRELAGGKLLEVRINRGDLAADLLLAEGLTDTLLRTHAVTRSHQAGIYIDHDAMQTYYVGAPQSDIRLRIYDKSAEIKHSEKDWFLPLWGLAENAGVWRVEYQLRREVLRSSSVNTIDDWMANRGALWRYLTENWFSLRLPDDENATRRTVHPLWLLVQSCAERLEGHVSELRRQRRSISWDTTHQLKMIAAQLEGYGARCGLSDWVAAWEAIRQDLQQHYHQRDYLTACQRKAIQLGITTQGDAA